MQSQIPPGALSPGTKLTVGTHQAAVKTYISEGGFAHVYVVYCSPVEDNNEIACLKRVQVPDKMHLNLLRAEVDAMKRLKGHPNIVKYLDSHAARLPDGQGYEVLLLMEYCAGNGLIDFMNTRLRDQLKEHEILKIMYDITYGLCAMHYLQPPLLHRDLKIENVLISGDGTFKLCDFGSSSPVLRPPRNSQEYHILEEDIQNHTTAQYRCPEMIDIYRGFPIDEKSDIWALGVFLYKLCFYTTPFEREGQLAILHANYTIPSQPQYSDRLKRVIQATLKEDPRSRPNVYQVLKEICLMRGVEVPVKDVYTEAFEKVKSRSHVPSQSPQPQPQPASQGAQTGALSVPSTSSLSSSKERPVPEVTPMYRGRPQVSKNPQSNSSVALNSINSEAPDASAVFSDPFALLDTGVNSATASKKPSPSPHKSESEQVSQKFPTVEELAKNLEQKTFYFDSPSITPINSHSDAEPAAASNTRVQYPPLPKVEKEDNPNLKSTGSSSYEYQGSSSSSSDDDGGIGGGGDDGEPAPPVLPRRPAARRPHDQQQQRPHSMYISAPPPELMKPQEGNLIDAVPQDDRDELKTILTGLSQRSNTVVLENDSNHIDSNVDFLKSLEDDQTISRRSSSHHNRKASANLTADWRSVSGRRPGSAASTTSNTRKSLDNPRKSIDSNDLLSDHPASNNGGNSWKLRRSGSAASTHKSHHAKKSSISSFKGRISDAFRKFDSSSPRNDMPPPPPPRTVSGGGIYTQSNNNSGVGKYSYSTDSLVSNQSTTESHTIGNEYQFPAAPPKSIQSRVNTFLNNNQVEEPPKRTAQGYGRYTDSPTISEPPPQTSSHSRHLSTISASSTQSESTSTASTRKPPPPPKPAKPLHLQSPRRSRAGLMGKANDASLSEQSSNASLQSNHEHHVHDQNDDWETNFNKKYPSLG